MELGGWMIHDAWLHVERSGDLRDILRKKQLNLTISDLHLFVGWKRPSLRKTCDF